MTKRIPKERMTLADRITVGFLSSVLAYIAGLVMWTSITGVLYQPGLRKHCATLNTGLMCIER